MIPSMHGVHHAMTPKSPLATPVAGGTNSLPFAGLASQPSTTPTASQGSAQGSSIATDLGQMTTDALTLLGLGAPSGQAGHGSQATQAYAASNGLIH